MKSRNYLYFAILHIHCGIHIVHIFLIQLFPQQLHSFAKPLEMNNLPFPKELDHIIHIRIVAKPQDIVIGHPRFLFCCV